MRQGKTHLFAIACTLTLIGWLTGNARAALLLYESFDYTNGQNLAGQGGSELGFDNGSTWNFGGAHAMTITTGSVAFGDLTVSGNSGYAASDNSTIEISAAIRPINFNIATGEVWMSWLTRTDITTTFSGQGLSLNSAGGNQDFALFSKRNASTGAGVIKYGTAGANADTGVGLVNGEAYLIIGKFDAGAGGNGTMWMVSESEFTSISADGVTEAELNSAVSASRIATVADTTMPVVTDNGTLRLNVVDTAASAGHAFAFDEFRVGTSVADVTPTGQVLAKYSFALPETGTFSGPQFASSDTKPSITASNLANHGFTGGGANKYIIDNTTFNTSDSTSPGLNLANADDTSATNYVSFTINPTANAEVTYTRISLFTGGFFANDEYNIELRVVIGGGLEQVLYSTTNTTGTAINSAVVPMSFDFADFTSAETTEWRLYVWNADGNVGGIRFDDITLVGVVTVPSPAALPAGLAMIGLISLRRRAH